MHIKHGNRYVTSDMQGLPLKEIKIGDHFVTFGKDYNTWCGEYDVTYATVFTQNLRNRLFSFEGFKLESNVSNYHDDDDIIEDSPVIGHKLGSSSNKFVERDYIKLGKDELFLLENEGSKGFLERDDELESDNSIINNIYKKIKNNLYLTMEFNDNKFRNRDSIIEFIPFEIHPGEYLVFMTKNEVNTKRRFWSKARRIYLMYTEKEEVYELYADFNGLFERAQHHYDSNRKARIKFSETVVMMKKDILREIEEKREHILQEELNNYFKDYYEVNGLVDPIYENKDLNLEAYPESYSHLSYRSAQVYVNRKKIYSTTSSSAGHNYRNEFRKAESILEFFHDNVEKYGVNPYDGKRYKDWKVVDYNKPGLEEYRDHEGIIFRTITPNGRIKAEHYVRLGDLYIKAIDTDEDIEAVKELKEREKMVKIMMEN